MKPISLIAFFLTIASSYADDRQRAEHSTFTPEQLAEHLGLTGGNWTVSFDEKLFCGFIVTETSDDGALTKKYFWSSDASQNHQFHFMHHVENKDGRGDSHKVSFSSVQEGEWKSEGENDRSRWKVSGGSGTGYNTVLPSGGGSRTRFRNNSVKITPESPELLYSWSSTETKRAFLLEIVFAQNPKKAEQDGADQPATAPESRRKGDSEPQPEAAGRSQ